ncbi:hypothetical protein ACWT_7507 [Actinoplanes sp. SE50]|uniref:hypothetical protein n=1 Tax=unclassified Actinoplanes TaxID=2626549 RepID=UPI00023EDCAE|nr:MULTISPECIES: hypothetical protein [unclassified Actinoplanes]AEV88517.1 hypothetical protein ACPL_7637 [Actinoplanes sp. SE50/110]ATO86922.1 hypothetical protein ACWT_7507 [Actinoplanes sp. SE50]SLM04340.1 hypothetical protein ACSP50_7645 [Actinoplanes sp. SE50/110]
MFGSSLRARPVIVVAVVAGLIVTGGVAWAQWRLSGSGKASATAGTVTNLQMTAQPLPNAPLYPGKRTALSVTVHNGNSFPVLVTLIQAGSGPVTADAAHRTAGCLTTGVSLITPALAVSWPIPARADETFRVSNAVTMTNASDSACRGATFTIPLAATGRSNAA